MDYCYVEFNPLDAASLLRTREAFSLVRSMKAGEIEIDELTITGKLTPKEISFFWNPSEGEMEEWNAHWKNTPVSIRISAAMACPQWDLGSMYESIWNGEYDLVDIVEVENRHFLAFNPGAYPFGGVSCLIAFLECFGHKILGYDDGTGYAKYEPRELWHSKLRTVADGNGESGD